jgi:hypothetical protein
MRMRWSPLLERLEWSAAATVTAVLMAGMFVKLGHAGWGAVIIAGLCLGGGIIDHLTSARRTGTG